MPFPIDLIRRLRQVYLDLPGLSLTPAQTRRLFTADRDDCAVALAALVDTGLLTRRGDQYWRTITSEPAPGEATRSRATSSDCRWADRVVAGPVPVWMAAPSGSWRCVRDGGPRVLDVRECRAGPRGDPRLDTRRRALERTVSTASRDRHPAADRRA